MDNRVGMYHPKMAGDARPLEVEVPKWEAAGWKLKERPLKKRTQKQAEPLAKPDDSAESA
jgi:hypothetical protein